MTRRFPAASVAILSALLVAAFTFAACGPTEGGTSADSDDADDWGVQPPGSWEGTSAGSGAAGAASLLGDAMRASARYEIRLEEYDCQCFSAETVDVDECMETIPDESDYEPFATCIEEAALEVDGSPSSETVDALQCLNDEAEAAEACIDNLDAKYDDVCSEDALFELSQCVDQFDDAESTCELDVVDDDEWFAAIEEQDAFDECLVGSSPGEPVPDEPTDPDNAEETNDDTGVVNDSEDGEDPDDGEDVNGEENDGEDVNGGELNQDDGGGD